MRRSLRRSGWDLVRFSASSSEWAQLVKLLSVHKTGVVFDVGANVGQFARNLRDAGFQGRIVSFEPSSSAHSGLAERAKRSKDNNWIVAPRMAIGDRDGQITMNISRNSVSSSVLPILEAHITAEPNAQYFHSEEVDIRKLDTIARDFLRDGLCPFLKLDVQGFEFEVLQGAQDFLNKICGIKLEMSLVPLYEGEHLFDAIFHRLEGLGFILWSLIPGFVDPNTGRLLQVDGIFFKS